MLGETLRDTAQHSKGEAAHNFAQLGTAQQRRSGAGLCEAAHSKGNAVPGDAVPGDALLSTAKRRPGGRFSDRPLGGFLFVSDLSVVA